MDYEKKYKEALEWARKVMQGKVGFVLDEVLEKFPELKENGDEKIRKEILDYIIKGSESCYDVQQYGREKFEKWIAWLESQGEHANFRNSIQVGDKVTRNQDGVLVNLSQLDRVAKKQGEKKLYVNDNAKEMFIKALERVEEQNNKGYKLTDCDKNSWWEDFKAYTSCIIEQKPADKVEPKFKVGDIVKHKDNPHLTYILKRFTDDGDYEFHAIGKDGHEGCTCFSVVKYQDEWELVEQKPVEDVDLPEFESYLCLMFQKFRTKGMCTNGEIIDYVKEHSQKLRDILVKPACSEEDEDIINKILCICDDFEKSFEISPASTKVIKEDVNKIDNWLKSLKERYTWKPSDEQMKALKEAVDEHFDIDGGALWHLYEDLKKLKE